MALAFLPSSLFNEANATSYPLFTTVEEVRSRFSVGTKVMIAIGGWGDTTGFSEAARTAEGRERWAQNVKEMVDVTGADGMLQTRKWLRVSLLIFRKGLMSIGSILGMRLPPIERSELTVRRGNGEDYKTHPNPTKGWEISAYSLLLSVLRKHLPSPLLISAAVPGLRRDMLAFTDRTLPLINPSLDFINLMTYDLMNRRDTVTKHHTGVSLSYDAIDAYVDGGIEPKKINLGFAFYVKWFYTAANSSCSRNPIGCPTVLMEDPDTGADLGQAGAFSYHDKVPKMLQGSWQRAQNNGQYDEIGGGHYYHDGEEHIWWSWDTKNAIGRKFSSIVESSGIGGVFAWGLGEDGDAWEHLKAMNLGVESWQERMKGSRRRCGTEEPPADWFREEL